MSLICNVPILCITYISVTFTFGYLLIISWKYNMDISVIFHGRLFELDTFPHIIMYKIYMGPIYRRNILYTLYTLVKYLYGFVYRYAAYVTRGLGVVSAAEYILYDRRSLWVRFTVNYGRRSRSSPAWVTKFLRFVSRDSPPQSRDEFRPTRVTGGGKTKSIARVRWTRIYCNNIVICYTLMVVCRTFSKTWGKKIKTSSLDQVYIILQ